MLQYLLGELKPRTHFQTGQYGVSIESREVIIQYPDGSICEFDYSEVPRPIALAMEHSEAFWVLDEAGGSERFVIDDFFYNPYPDCWTSDYRSSLPRFTTNWYLM